MNLTLSAFTAEHFRSALKTSRAVFLLALITCSPVMVGNIHYWDDYYRMENGWADMWIYNGRPLTTWGMQLLNFSSVINDLSPIYLISGLALLSLMLTFALQQITAARPAALTLMSMAVIISPFTAQPILYAYDSLSILLAIGLSFFVCLRVSARQGPQILYSVTVSMAMLCIYQTAMNQAWINAIFILALSMARHKDARTLPLKHALCVMIGLALAMVLYRASIPALFHTEIDNQSRGGATPVGSIALSKILGNLESIYTVIKAAFPDYRAVPVFAMSLVGGAACWSLARQQLIEEQIAWKRYLGAVLLATIPVLATLPIAGFLAVFSVLDVQPRMLTAFSSTLIVFFYLGYVRFPRLRTVLAVLMAMHLWLCAVFMLATFRAIVNQNNFNDGLAINIRGDLSRLYDAGIDSVAIIGKNPWAPASEPYLKNYPLASYFLTRPFAENDGMLYYTVSIHLMLKLRLVSAPTDLETYIPKTIVSSNCIYRLYRYQNTAVIDFDWPSCPTGR